MGLEGTMAKDGASRYTGRRSSSWVKLRAERTGDFAIVGMSPPKGSRVGPGLAPPRGLGRRGRRHWSMPVVSVPGFSDADLTNLAELLSARQRQDPPCHAPAGEDAAVGNELTDGHLMGGRIEDQTWVEPDDGFICEVRYKEWTPHGMLRHPVFLRLRDDKPLEECVRRAAPPRRRSRPAGDAETAGRRHERVQGVLA